MSDQKVVLSKEQVMLIEELAHINETMGHQPAMSKIMALLVVSDDTDLTFEQIKHTLGLSKSAVSQALSQLLMSKKISYKNKLGDRKRYFQLRIADWDAHIVEQFEGITALISVFKKVLAIRPESTADFNSNLKRMTEFMTLLHNQVVALYDKFQNEHQ